MKREKILNLVAVLALTSSFNVFADDDFKTRFQSALMPSYNNSFGTYSAETECEDELKKVEDARASGDIDGRLAVLQSELRSCLAAVRQANYAAAGYNYGGGTNNSGSAAFNGLVHLDDDAAKFLNQREGWETARTGIQAVANIWMTTNNNKLSRHYIDKSFESQTDIEALAAANANARGEAYVPTNVAMYGDPETVQSMVMGADGTQFVNMMKYNNNRGGNYGSGYGMQNPYMTMQRYNTWNNNMQNGYYGYSNYRAGGNGYNQYAYNPSGTQFRGTGR